MIIDTHAHIYVQQFDEDREEMLQRATDTGVDRIYMPNIDNASLEEMFALAEAQPNLCYPMVGLHPCSVTAEVDQQLDKLKPYLDTEQIYGIGEAGLDFYWDMTYRKEQERALREQLEWAKDLDLPIVLHTREATDESILLVREAQDGRLRGIFHCFGGTKEQAAQIIDLGFFIGIGGVITFKNAGLDREIKGVPLSHIVLETDAPYLAPHPYRGKRNEPSFLPTIINRIAEVWNCSPEEVKRRTGENALKVFENL